ncbi:MAG TPA: sigma factor-like helix-turn-helix DNA-binding protein [bacterium]|nr:sigma factor-like helix-turn-helix DNA-binding protein [bacterium]
MTISGLELQTHFSKILNNLTSKEQDVISRRIGLGCQHETLQSIGNTYKITRERVRQIEDVGIKKIGRVVKGTYLERVQVLGEQLLRTHGGLLSRDKLVSAIVREIGISEPINHGIIEVVLQADFNIQKSKPQLGVDVHFYLPEIGKKLIQEVHKEALKILAKRGDIMEHHALYEMVKANLFPTYGKIETILISGILEVFHDVVRGEEKFIGLEKWKILNPSTLKDKAIYIMKKEKRPFHFMELTNAISEHFREPVKVPTIHNELIRNEEFVLIGRGIYVLKEWGYKSGTVMSVIMEILEKHGEAMPTEMIISSVLRVRQVKPSTIYMNLQNKRYIERVGRNLYRLRSK